MGLPRTITLIGLAVVERCLSVCVITFEVQEALRCDNSKDLLRRVEPKHRIMHSFFVECGADLDCAPGS
jgi:hypothetical protein